MSFMFAIDILGIMLNGMRHKNKQQLERLKTILKILCQLMTVVIKVYLYLFITT